MKTTKVKKDSLLAQLQTNREKHKTEFEAARKTWEAKVIERLRAVHDRACDDNFDDVEFPLRELPKPENFLKSYDLAISRLEWEEDEVVELDEREFANYVQDNWEWRDRFVANTAFYAAE